jgi:hypothetical protein
MALRETGWIWVDHPTLETLGEKIDANATRLAVHEEDTRDALTVLDDATDCIRYGLMAGSSEMRH